MATVIQFPDSLSVAGNIKDVILSSAITVNFKIKVGTDMLLEENYTPIDSLVTIRLRDILPSLLKTVIPTANVFEQVDAYKTFTFEVDSVPTNCLVVAGGVDATIDPTVFLKANWLTWQPQQKRVKYTDPEWLSYFAVEAVTVRLKAYFNGHDPETINLTVLTAGKFYSLNVNFQYLSGLFTTAQPVYFDIWTEGVATVGPGTVSTPGSSTTLTGVGTQFTNTFKVGDTITVAGEGVRTIATITSDTVLDVTVAFSITPRSAVTYTFFPRLSFIQRYVLMADYFEFDDLFVFENTLGGIDTVRLSGNKEENNQFDISSVLIDEDTSDYDVEYGQVFLKNTGYFTSARERSWLNEFLNSTLRYLVTPDGLKSVTISKPEAKVDPLDSSSFYYVFNFALSRQTKFLNFPRAETLPTEVEIISPEEELFFLAPRLVEFPTATLDDSLLFPVQMPFVEEWKQISYGAIKSDILSNVATADHMHGNITNAGAIGATADQVVITGPSGVLTTASRSGIDSRTAFPAAAHTLDSHSATAWRMFYSNATSVQELAFSSTAGDYFKSAGASAVPVWGNLGNDVRATVLTGLNIAGGTVIATDTILEAFGKVQNQITAMLGGAIFQSVWNAATNSPALVSSAGTKGHYYIVSVSGTTNLDGITDWQVGDWAIFDGTVWRKVDNTDAVSSVNGNTGSVQTSDLTISNGLVLNSGTTYNAFSAKTLSVSYGGNGSANTVARSDHDHSGIYEPAITKSTGYLRYTGTAWEFKNETYLTSVTAHNLLSATHGDTTAATVTRGGIITGQLASPKWQILSFPVTPTGKALVATATDIAWSSAAVILEGDSRLSDARTPTSHAHGNITNAGLIGTTANIPIITGTAGILQAGSFGTGSGTFCQGNDSRLSDARTPTAHASSHVTGGSDVISNVVAAGNSGLMIGADKTKLDGIATGANNYVHPTSDGSLHVTATSTTSEGKVLQAGATAGVFAWSTNALTIGANASVSGSNTGDQNLSGYSLTSHTHDDRYYTETEIQTGSISMRSLIVNPDGVPSNNLGSPTIAEMALFQEQFSNKTDFYDITKLTFETYNGTTWTDITATIADSDKRAFLGGDTSSGIQIPYGTVQYRITIRSTSYVYLNALYMYWSSSGNNSQVQIWKKHDSGAWTQHTGSTTTISSWPGHMYLPFSTIPWNPTAVLGTHYHEVRVNFTPNWTHASNVISLYKIQWWGGYPAGKRYVYSVDSLKNVSFPSNLAVTGTLDIQGIILKSSGDRPGLLETNRLGTNAWAGVQAKFSDTGLWGFMGSETQCGIYDDVNSKWILLHNKNAGLNLYYNGVIKLITSNVGVTVTGETNTTTLTAGGVSNWGSVAATLNGLYQLQHYYDAGTTNKRKYYWTQATASLYLSSQYDNNTWTRSLIWFDHDGGVNVPGYSGSWGVHGMTGLNTIMGTTGGATWLLTGTSGGTKRGGIQLLDTGASIRLYANTNRLEVTTSGVNYNDVALASTASPVFTGDVSITPSTNKWKIKYIGTHVDYRKVVILLHAAYNGTLLANNYCVGRIFMDRGSVSSGKRIEVAEINTGSGYNTDYGVHYSTGSTVGRLVTVLYNSVKYIAYELPYAAQRLERIDFEGYINSSATEELTLVEYYNTQTSTVINTEINSSITAFVNGNYHFDSGNARFTGTITEGSTLLSNKYAPISHAHGDIANDGTYSSKTAKYVLAAPNASAGIPTFRLLVASDIPALSYRADTWVPAWGDVTSKPTTFAPIIGSGAADAVAGNDSRLSDARTPTAHASSHVTGGSDVIANVVAAGNSGLMTGADKTKLDGIATGANNYAHPTSDGSLHVTATGTTSDNKILQAGATAGTFAWETLADAGISAVGHTQAESTITFTDIVTGDASITSHGYLPKLGAGTTNFLRADGTWATPPGTYVLYKATVEYVLTGDITSHTHSAVSSHAITTHSATAWRMFYSNATTTAIQELALGAAGTLLRSAGATSIPAWSTLTMPLTIAEKSIFVANSANTLVALSVAANQSIRLNSGATAWEAYTASAVSVTNQSDNRLVTSTETNDVLNAESSLTFDGSILGLSGNLRLNTGADRAISMQDSTSITYGFSIVGQKGYIASIGGNVSLTGGAGGANASGTGGAGGALYLVSGIGGTSSAGYAAAGNIYIYGGGGYDASLQGNIFIGNNGTTDYGRVLFQSGSATAPGISFRADPDTGIYNLSANTVGIAAGGVLGLAISDAAVYIGSNPSGRDLAVTKSKNGDVIFQIQNLDTAGTATRSILLTYTDNSGSSMGMYNYGTGNTGSLYGEAMAKGSALVFGANNDKAIIGVSKATTPLMFATNGAVRMELGTSGILKLNNLAGTGSRVVVADASGNLSASSSLITDKGYTMSFQDSITNPVDSQGYHIGILHFMNTDSYSTVALSIPKSGTVKYAHIRVYLTGTVSSESFTVYVSIGGLSSQAIATISSTAFMSFLNSSMSLSVTAGDLITIRIVTPAWTTNPTGMAVGGFIYIE